MITFVGNIGLVVTVVLAFWMTGWQGGLAMLPVSFFAAPLLAGVILFPFMRAGSRVGIGDHLSAPAAWSSTQPAPIPTLDLLMSQWDEDEREHAELAARPAIAAVLTAHSAGPEAIKRIEGEILMLRLGKRTARKVVSDPKLLSEHLALEAQGVTGEALAHVYLDRFGPP